MYRTLLSPEPNFTFYKTGIRILKGAVLRMSFPFGTCLTVSERSDQFLHYDHKQVSLDQDLWSNRYRAFRKRHVVGSGRVYSSTVYGP